MPGVCRQKVSRSAYVPRPATLSVCVVVCKRTRWGRRRCLLSGNAEGAARRKKARSVSGRKTKEAICAVASRQGQPLGGSTAPIGGIAVRRNQQRHVVVLLLGRNTETQHYHIQKRRLRQLDTAGAVVIARMELNLINPGAIIIALQQRCIDPAVAVGDRTGDQFQLRTLNA